MCSLAKAVGEPPLCFLRVQQEAKEEAKSGRVEAIQAAGLYAPGGERLNHHQKPNKRAAFFLGIETAPKEPPERVKPQGGAAVLRLHTTESRRPAARFATPTQGKTNGRPYERSSRKQRIEPLKTQIPNLSTAKVVKSSKEAKHKGRRVEALPCAETSSPRPSIAAARPAQMIERKEQRPARNRESRQTTAESGGGGLVSVFAPPYGEDAPPAFHRYENAKTWTRGANHRNERGETWTRERGERLNAAQTAAVCSSFVVYFATLQARAPTSSGAKIEQPQKVKASTPPAVW